MRKQRNSSQLLDQYKTLKNACAAELIKLEKQLQSSSFNDVHLNQEDKR